MYLRFVRIILLVTACMSYAVSYYECNQRLVPCGCGLKHVQMNRHIVTGENVVPFSWPMIVSIRYDCFRNGNISTHCCSGTILSDSYVLTAAHCVEMISEGSLLAGNVTAVAGIHSLSQEYQIIRKVNQIFLHPNWTRLSSGFRHDIAIIHLDKPLEFNKNLLITPACLPPRLSSMNDTLAYPPHNISLIMIGWDFVMKSKSINHDILQQAGLVSMHHDHSRCSASINDIESQFCAAAYEGYKGPCAGDSGGLILRWISDRWEQVGLISYVKHTCDAYNYSIISTRIARYSDWIDDIVKERNYTNSTSVTTIIRTLDRPPHVYVCNKTSVSCGCGFENVGLASLRIVGGEEAIPYSWSMIISLRYDCLNNSNPTTHCCGGTILNKYYILTAAHCVDKINQSSILSQNITIAAGIHNLTEEHQIIRRVDQIIIHSDYSGSTDYFKNDIAILHLSEPFDFDTNPRITRTCRSSRHNFQAGTIEYPSNGSMLVVIGWGLINRPMNVKPQLLQQLNVYAMHHIHPPCAQNIGYVHVQFCAGVYGDNKGPCHGDSGGPIMLWSGDHWEQVGIASYVIRGCAAFGYPSVYTRLSSFHDWIEWIINPNNYTTTTTTIAYRPPTIYHCNNKKTFCGCGNANVTLTSSRLIGGNEAVPYSWTMTVSIRYNCYRNGNFEAHCCGGTILNEYYILSSANCFDQMNTSDIISQNITIAAGIHNLTEMSATIRTIDRIFIHPEYTGQRFLFKNDIAILHLAEPLNLETNPRISRTCLPSRIDSTVDLINYPSNGSLLAVVGWGALDKSVIRRPQLLQQLIIYSIHHNESTCTRSIGHVNVQFCGGLYEGGKGICSGDSGGPVFKWLDDRWEQVGITSYMMHGCASVGYQSVFTRLSSFYDWIDDHINQPNATTSINVNSTATANSIRTTTLATSGIMSSYTQSNKIIIVGTWFSLFTFLQ